jgi:hypothetical protein
MVCGLAGFVFPRHASCTLTKQHVRKDRPAGLCLSEYILNAHNVVHVHTLKQFKRPVINKLPVALPMCFFYGHPKTQGWI